VVSRSLGGWCACACACACAACACAREDGAEEMEERNNRVGSKENKKEEEETKGGKTHKVAPTQPGPLLNGPALLGGRTATASRCSSRVFAISFSSSSSSARLAGGRLIRLRFGLVLALIAGGRSRPGYASSRVWLVAHARVKSAREHEVAKQKRRGGVREGCAGPRPNRGWSVG